MAGGQASGRVLLKRRRFDAAPRESVRAARGEGASGRDVDRARRLALEQILPRVDRLLLEGRRGGKQRLGIRMLRVEEEIAVVGDLDHLAQIHHRDARADFSHHRQIVRDEDIGEFVLLLQTREQVDELALLALVDRGKRLIQDQKLWIEDQRARDRDALALARGERIRQFVVEIGREADLRHGGGDAGPQHLRPLLAADAQAFLDHAADAGPWRERIVRVLEQELELVALGDELPLGKLAERYAAHDDAAAVGPFEPGEEAGQRRLSAAGFADDPEILARHDVKRHAAHRLNVRERIEGAALAGLVGAMDMIDPHQRRLALRTP